MEEGDVCPDGDEKLAPGTLLVDAGLVFLELEAGVLVLSIGEGEDRWYKDLDCDLE